MILMNVGAKGRREKNIFDIFIHIVKFTLFSL